MKIDDLKTMKSSILASCIALVIIATSFVYAEPDVKLVSFYTNSWSQWRGPYRDGVVREKGLLKKWPLEGPCLVWRTKSLGSGYSSPVIADGRIFITGDVQDKLLIFALDMNGKINWVATNGAAWKGPYPGARASVAYSDGRIYHLNAHGRLACLESSSGNELWHLNITNEFDASNITWAFSECLLVDEKKVYVTPGGRKALMAAIDKISGKTVWMSAPLRVENKESQESISTDPAGYTSPVMFEFGNRRLIVNCSQSHAFCVDSGSGEILWTYPMPTRYKVLAVTPVVYKDSVFVTGPDSQGGTLLKITSSNAVVSVRTKWISKLDTCHGGVVAINDIFVGSWYRNRRGWACLDANTGETLHQTSALAKGSVIYADGLFYLLTEDGIMALAKIDRANFNIISQFQFIKDHQNDVWAHPVIYDGKLYLRYHNLLSCYDVQNE